MTRREFLVLAGSGLTGWAVLSKERTVSPLDAGASFLASLQSPDGAWRSAQYGAFRSGDALTPLALWALTGVPIADEPLRRGLRWLEHLTATQTHRDEPWAGLQYPLFTASYSAQVFAVARDAPRAAFWADVVERLRISEFLGWRAGDASCGAWSDSPTPPWLPPGSATPPDMLAPNLSATVLALQALAAAGRHDRLAAAAPFVAQCQNFADPAGPFDDGGFVFAPGDSVRNKAGVVGRDAGARERFHSYGSATCDGLLALGLCGDALSEPRRRAALRWMQGSAAGARHSGVWAMERADERESLRFYHAQGLAAVLSSAALEPGLERWVVDQSRALADDLRAGQNEAGAWIGACPDSFEDDPLVATAFAVRAMSQISSLAQRA